MKKPSNTISNPSPLLTLAEYQEKAKTLTTPESVKTFMDEFIAPAMKEITKSEHGHSKKVSPIQANIESPWYDVADNDTEAMIIDLYARGMSTRNISIHLKKYHNIDIA